jgi:hypothetical protein
MLLIEADRRVAQALILRLSLTGVSMPPYAGRSQHLRFFNCSKDNSYGTDEIDFDQPDLWSVSFCGARESGVLNFCGKGVTKQGGSGCRSDGYVCAFCFMTILNTLPTIQKGILVSQITCS